MITIVKDGHTIKCSENTFKIMYKRLGYEIVRPKVVEEEETKVKEKKETIDEIPVIEMKTEKKINKTRIGKKK